MMTFIVRHRCEGQEALIMAQSLLRGRPSISLDGVEVELAHVPRMRVPAGERLPKARKGVVQDFVLMIVTHNPGLCSRQLIQLPATVKAGFRDKQIVDSANNSKKRGLLHRKGKVQGGWYITEKGQQVLNASRA